MTPSRWAYVQFVAARVVAYCAANPCPPDQLLTETPPRASRTCKRGHVGAPRDAQRRCTVCERERLAMKWSKR